MHAVAGKEVHSNEYPHQPEERPPEDVRGDPGTDLAERGDAVGFTSRE